MDIAGVDFVWRKAGLEAQLQRIDLLDLERMGNAREKVFHIMWKRSVQKNRHWTLVTRIRIVRWLGERIFWQRSPARSQGLARRSACAHHRLCIDTMKETALPLFGINSFFTLFHTWLKGEPVGEDAYGNRYYREKASGSGRRERRWVVYSKEAEPTRVPPGWVGWLHGRIKEPPSDTPLPSPHFEKEPLPNLTGTTEAYLPPGAVQRGGARERATGDYEAWRPE